MLGAVISYTESWHNYQNDDPQMFADIARRSAVCILHSNMIMTIVCTDTLHEELHQAYVRLR